MKLIFLDIDGTLVAPGKSNPPDSALKAIRLAQAAGNKVLLCTGRNRGMLAPLLRYGFDGVIGSSGGYVTYGDEIIFDRPMTDEERTKLLTSLDDNGIFYTVECRDQSYAHEGFKNLLRSRINEGNNSELLRWQEQIEKDLHVLPLSAWQGEPVYKLVFTCEERSQLDQPIRDLSDFIHFVVQDGWPGMEFINGELQPSAFDKGTAVRQVCEYLNVPLSDTFGFGDSMNDLEMIETVGTGICMENGSTKLKQRADAVCPSVNEDGLYKAFEQYGLF